MDSAGRKLVVGWVPILLWLYGGIVVFSGIMRFVVTGQALITGQPVADPVFMVYVQQPWLPAIHILAGTVFMLLGPLQFIPSIRRYWPKTHRVSGRVFIVCGLIAAATGLGVEFLFPLRGGYVKRAAMVLFSLAMLVALALAWRAAIRRRIDLHRAWVVRAYAIGLALSTTRLYFIPAYLMYGNPSKFEAATVTWLGFCLNCLVAEWIVRRTRRMQRSTSPGAAEAAAT
ncbi:MAG: DUF2306 domain-containing protein [Lysobacter sp.]|nr:DUF2306 domain-containing protein [Lysobacter sp.]